ncbi:MAG: eS10 family ribosomal protein [Roseburia sp.]|nr:eS10 family ribosomal protein [Roseburia sp.]
MAITSKLGEADISDAAMYALLDAGHALDTTAVKAHVRDLLEPAGVNRAPLVNRNDEVIDQIIRNIVSHRHDSQNNIIYRGYVDYDNGYWTLTDKGQDYLRNRMKRRFEWELN